MSNINSPRVSDTAPTQPCTGVNTADGDVMIVTEKPDSTSTRRKKNRGAVDHRLSIDFANDMLLLQQQLHEQVELRAQQIWSPARDTDVDLQKCMNTQINDDPTTTDNL